MRSISVLSLFRVKKSTFCSYSSIACKPIYTRCYVMLRHIDPEELIRSLKYSLSPSRSTIIQKCLMKILSGFLLIRDCGRFNYSVYNFSKESYYSASSSIFVGLTIKARESSIRLIETSKDC